MMKTLQRQLNLITKQNTLKKQLTQIILKIMKKYINIKNKHSKCLKEKENIKVHNPNWPDIPDYPYRILIFGGSRSGKAHALRNLKIRNQILIKFTYMQKIHMKQYISF